MSLGTRYLGFITCCVRYRESKYDETAATAITLGSNVSVKLGKVNHQGEDLTETELSLLGEEHLTEVMLLTVNDVGGTGSKSR